ncbi:MAG: toll/interleukin-1 receptor domain-containing protein [bacterium]|nr:toll/interleukin-1 receptor domain-containing protein [bacterium]
MPIPAGQPEDRPPRVFFCYRHSGADSDLRNELHGHLIEAFGPSAIFRDVDSLQPGERWTQRLADEIRQCHVFLAVIERDWHLRFDEDDVVRREIACAVQARRAIVPVLLNGAPPLPAGEHQPKMLRDLASLHYQEVRQTRIHEGTGALVSRILELTRLDRRVRAAVEWLVEDWENGTWDTGCESVEELRELSESSPTAGLPSRPWLEYLLQIAEDLALARRYIAQADWYRAFYRLDKLRPHDLPRCAAVTRRILLVGAKARRRMLHESRYPESEVRVLRREVEALISTLGIPADRIPAAQEVRTLLKELEELYQDACATASELWPLDELRTELRVELTSFSYERKDLYERSLNAFLKGTASIEGRYEMLSSDTVQTKTLALNVRALLDKLTEYLEDAAAPIEAWAREELLAEKRFEETTVFLYRVLEKVLTEKRFKRIFYTPQFQIDVREFMHRDPRVELSLHGGGDEVEISPVLYWFRQLYDPIQLEQAPRRLHSAFQLDRLMFRVRGSRTVAIDRRSRVDLLVFDAHPEATERLPECSVRFRIGETHRKPALRTLQWHGGMAKTSFHFRPTSGKVGEVLLADWTVRMDGVAVARVSCELRVADSESEPGWLASQVQRFRSALALFAWRDRERFVRRLAVLRVASPGFGVTTPLVFPFDDAELSRTLERFDLVLLFWSRHTRRSDRVHRICRLAKLAQGIGFIEPVAPSGAGPSDRKIERWLGNRAQRDKATQP